MQTFTSAEGGYLARVSREERGILLQAIAEVVRALDAPLPSGELLQALRALEPEEEREQPNSLSLRRLLPPLSENPRIAAQLRALTEDSLRSVKSERLQVLERELAEPSGPDGQIFVPEEQLWQWLAGINDLRLSISGALGIHAETPGGVGVADVQEQFGPQNCDPSEEQRNVFVASVYSALGWWQTSLIERMEASTQPT